MSRARELLGHPFWQALLIIVAAYLLFAFGVAYLPPLVGVHSAPVPHSVLLQYMGIVIVGVLLHVSSDEARWRRFREPNNRNDAEVWIRSRTCLSTRSTGFYPGPCFS